MSSNKEETQTDSSLNSCINNTTETPNLFNNYELDSNINQELQTDIDEELIKAYIGKNESKIRRKGGTILPILLGPVYYFYRKLYVEGLIWLGIILIGEFLINNSTIYVLSSLTAGFIFRILYLNNVKRNVVKIKKENSNKSIEELKNICSKRGGTNELVVFIAIIFYGGLMYLESNKIEIDTVTCKNVDSEKIIMKVNSKGEYVNTIDFIYEADNEYALSMMYSLMKSEYPNEKIEQNGLSLILGIDMKDEKVNKKEYINNLEQKGYTCQK